jgi:hypothetical protein
MTQNKMIQPGTMADYEEQHDKKFDPGKAVGSPVTLYSVIRIVRIRRIVGIFSVGAYSVLTVLLLTPQ